MEMENQEEIMLLILDFYKGNPNYTDKDLLKFKMDNNGILFGISLDVVKKALYVIGKSYEGEYIDAEFDDNEGFEVEDLKDEDKLDSGNSGNSGKGLKIRRSTIIDEIKEVGILEGIKTYNYKRSFKQKLRSTKKGIKKVINKASPYILRVLKFLKNGFISLIKSRADLDKQIILYKKTVQKDLDDARKEFDKDKDDEKSNHAEDIQRLSEGDSIIPKLSFKSSIKVGFLGMFYDIRILIIFIVSSIIIQRYYSTKTDIIESYIITLAFILGFLSLYMFLIIYNIKRKIKENIELKDFLWKDFPYGLGISDGFKNIGKGGYVEDSSEVVDGGESGREVAGVVDGVGVVVSGKDNPYSKEWDEIFRDLFNIKGDFDIPKIMEINERTEVHVIKS